MSIEDNGYGVEPVVAIVGFLGAGKTTLLKHLVEKFVDIGWDPFVILNDYVSADLDARQIADEHLSHPVRALTGSCICCDGINELREAVNLIPKRENGITLIEANGTTDAETLMGFLGVGLDQRFLPPVQISVIDTKNWQTRGINNDLEIAQTMIASLVLLSHINDVSRDRKGHVGSQISRINPHASVVTLEELDILLIPALNPVHSGTSGLDHGKAHWSSCSIDLTDLPDYDCIQKICEAIPPEILRIKGCTRIAGSESFTYFERCPDGRLYARPYTGLPVTGAKLLAVGPGSEPEILHRAVSGSLKTAKNPSN